jgi:cobalt/nickel transport system permease protein
MHIEPGVLSQAKVAFASAAAVALLGAHVPALLKQPTQWLRTLLAATFFSLFMQAFHMQVGPSELHFVGAMPIYLAFGFLPTLFGFALGLLAQGLLFEPQDLVHLSVNTLSLAVPLLALHHTLGRKLHSLTVAQVLKLDAAYYAGVTLMVGFWLSIGEVATPFIAWATFASSYLALVALEPLVTLGVLALVRRWRDTRAGALCFVART